MNFQKIASKYGVTLTDIDHDGYGRNGGGSGGGEISIKPCDENFIYELSFWHELGHILLSRSMIERTHYMSKLSNEGAAWELGLNEAARHGRIWDYDSKEMKWAKQQLASYVNGEYDDIKAHYKFGYKTTGGNKNEN